MQRRVPVADLTNEMRLRPFSTLPLLLCACFAAPSSLVPSCACDAAKEATGNVVQDSLDSHAPRFLTSADDRYFYVEVRMPEGATNLRVDIDGKPAEIRDGLVRVSRKRTSFRITARFDEGIIEYEYSTTIDERGTLALLDAQRETPAESGPTPVTDASARTEDDGDDAWSWGHLVDSAATRAATIEDPLPVSLLAADRLCAVSIDDDGFTDLVGATPDGSGLVGLSGANGKQIWQREISTYEVFCTGRGYLVVLDADRNATIVRPHDDSLAPVGHLVAQLFNVDAGPGCLELRTGVATAAVADDGRPLDECKTDSGAERPVRLERNDDRPVGDFHVSLALSAFGDNPKLAGWGCGGAPMCSKTASGWSVELPWSAPKDREVLEAIDAPDAITIVRSGSPAMLRVDTATKTVGFSVDLPREYRLLHDDGHHILLRSDKDLAAYDATTGRLVWTRGRG